MSTSGPVRAIDPPAVVVPAPDRAPDPDLPPAADLAPAPAPDPPLDPLTEGPAAGEPAPGRDTAPDPAGVPAGAPSPGGALPGPPPGAPPDSPEAPGPAVPSSKASPSAGLRLPLPRRRLAPDPKLPPSTASSSPAAVSVSSTWAPSGPSPPRRCLRPPGASAPAGGQSAVMPSSWFSSTLWRGSQHRSGWSAGQSSIIWACAGAAHVPPSTRAPDSHSKSSVRRCTNVPSTPGNDFVSIVYVNAPTPQRTQKLRKTRNFSEVTPFAQACSRLS